MSETPLQRSAETVESSPEHPVYLAEQLGGGRAEWAVVVDEGWRRTIVCTGMYEWSAEWMVGQLQGKPYAPGWVRR